MKVILPKDRSEIKLRDYIALIKITKRKDLNDEQKAKRIFSLFSGVPYNKLDKVSTLSYTKVSRLITTALNTPKYHKPYIKINKKKYHLTTKVLSFGEFIDLATYKEDPERAHNLCAVLLRRKRWFKEETYKGTNHIADYLKLAPLSFYDLIAKQSDDVLKNVKDNYPELFIGGTSEGDDALNYFKKHGWGATVFKLTNNNILNQKEILNLDHRIVLNYLVIDSDYNKLQAKLLKKK